MNNQPNQMVTLEWLLPIFNQQLSQMSDGWQADATATDFAGMVQPYHQIRGALIIANLPILGRFAAQLGLLATAPHEALDTVQRRQGLFAHQLLQRELTQYVQTGHYHRALLDKTFVELNELLSQLGVSANAPLIEASLFPDSARDSHIQALSVPIPSHEPLTALQPAQYQQLILVWRQHVQQLLAHNRNEPIILALLEKVGHYLWQTTDIDIQQQLWYLTTLWLNNLSNNETPQPAHYAAILSHLDQVINTRYQHAISADSHAQKHSLNTDDSLGKTSISDDFYEGLLADIYLQISGLKHLNAHTQTLLSELTQPQDITLRFLPRILTELEVIIFTLDNPQALVPPLQQLKKQLGQRGWVIYASQVALILEDIEQSGTSEAAFAQMQWQIERQLQELYSAIYHTEQAIRIKIGEPTSFLSAPSPQSALLDSEMSGQPAKETSQIEAHQLSELPDMAESARDNLRQLRIAIEDVKHNFNSYVQRQQNYLLPTADVFVEVGNAFDDMGLPSIRPVTDQLGQLFSQLEAHKIQTLSWDLTQSLAHSLSSFELLLDGLAQQIFDQQILTQASAHISAAKIMVEAVIAAPDAVTNTYMPANILATDVVRYDDDGESVPEVDIEVEVEEIISSDQAASDDFEVDEEIREIFIEEADEVLAAIKVPLADWQQDNQNITALKDIIRGFQTLQGSGRMAGALSISELASSIETVLNRILDKTLVATDDVLAVITQAIDALPVLIADYAASQAPSINTTAIIVQSQHLLLDTPIHLDMAGADGLGSIQNDTQDTAQHTEFLDNHLESTAAGSDTDVSANKNAEQAPIASEMNSTLNAPNAFPALLESFITDAEPLATDTDDADPDIKEIFIEEAEEVLAEIVPLYEQWRLTATDLSRLGEVRRGFHTLKGSGRMVGAFYSAELAWSIENMLNRVLDHSITLSPDSSQLISDVLAAYPDLISTFANDTHDYPAILPFWVACARAYSKNQEDNFSYSALRSLWLSEGLLSDSVTDEESVTGVETATAPSIDALDSSIVESSIVESTTEESTQAPTVATPRTEEEQEFCEIFIDEAQSLLEDIKHFADDHHNQNNIPVSDDIVRAFHTLRAAAGSTALDAISHVSATIERNLEHLQQYDKPMNTQHVQAIAQSAVLIEGYLQDYEQDSPTSSIEADNYQQQQDIESLQALLNGAAAPQTVTDSELSVAQLLNTGIDALLDTEWQLKDALSTQDIEKAQGYLNQQRRQIKTLAAQAVESPKFITILDALDEVYAFLEQHPQAAQHSRVQAALLAGHEELVGLFDALAGSMSLKINKEVLTELQAVLDDDSVLAESRGTLIKKQAREVKFEDIDTEPELLSIFLDEVQDIEKLMTHSFREWREDIGNKDSLRTLQRYMHVITGGARMAGIDSVSELTHGARNVYRGLELERIPLNPQWVDIMEMIQETLTQQINYIKEYQKSFFVTELIDQWREFARTKELPEVIDLILPMIEDDRFSAFADDTVSTSVEGPSEIVYIDRLIAQSWPNGQPDPDILEVFLEEAEELIASSSQYLQLFLNNNSDVSSLKSLQRDLHTIKGGARMVAANGIADLAHEMETVYEDLASRRRPATKMISKLLTNCHDWLADSIFILKKQVNPPIPVALIHALQLFSKNPDSLKKIPSESLHAQRSTVLAAQSKKKIIQAVENINEMPLMTGSFAAQEQITASNEMVRISGDLIEHMINLSGESAINRARIDMGMSSLTYSLEEMGTTVQRLADQLRRMESELETQILSQIDDVLFTDEDFDPLEMDQYSALNQLSKSLSESASDLIDINGTLLEKTKDSEGLLLQLSRTQTELQDGLMNSRMVPFSRITPRFERLVRQISNELNKSVELTIINADDEMDRSILERITSPIEHMLRNAVDHGIDNVPTRLKAGKDRTGHITLEVQREGSEVVIHLTDDGRGIDIEAVRKKAISQGLIEPDDTSLTDLEVMQYIFSAGLTTTKKVTQVSGRGVGMDVVISEIRQLGGVVSVKSKAGKGSRFTIRVPLTVAVTDALVVRAADRYYAIPLVQIERVIRISPEKLYDYYQSGETTLEVDDNEYRIRYLNEILSGNRLNELMVNTNTSFPLIIIKSRSGQKQALQVDQIEGSRIEVVVKPLGKQLAHISGISAATIMGNGSVMLILDLIALMRNTPALKEVKAVAKAEHSLSHNSQPTILVIDDSVTVRKVTSRFLERQGYNVMLAKDGVDAIEILQEATPDLMLLDIEMPRMDGFEVAVQVRHNSRLKDIPIIMITSRTGEKHRERALDIGVNDYMGKPFQENELLNKIQLLLGLGLRVGQDGQ